MKKIIITALITSLLVSAYSDERLLFPDFGQLFTGSELDVYPTEHTKIHYEIYTDLTIVEAKNILSEALGSGWTEKKLTDEELNRNRNLTHAICYEHNKLEHVSILLGIRNRDSSEHKRAIIIKADNRSIFQKPLPVLRGDFPDTKDTGKLDIGL